jgi:hypothetical protein
MLKIGRVISYFSLCAMLVFALSTAFAPSAKAASVLVTSELMIESEAVTDLAIGYVAPATTPQTTDWYSVVMQPLTHGPGTGDSLQFSYGTQFTPQQMYDGMPLTVSDFASATVASPNAFSDGSSFTVKGNSYSTAGLLTVTDFTHGDLVIGNYDIFNGGGTKIGDIHIRVWIDTTTWNSYDSGYLTDANGNKIPHSDFRSFDHFNTTTGNWDIHLFPLHPGHQTVGVDSHGTTPPLGGGGSYTQTIESVPEPASIALLGIGMTGFLALRRLFKRSKTA